MREQLIEPVNKLRWRRKLQQPARAGFASDGSGTSPTPASFAAVVLTVRT